MCVCERERERACERESVCTRKRVRECVCVCLRASVYVCVCTRALRFDYYVGQLTDPEVMGVGERACV